MSKIYQIYGSDAHIMTKELLKAANAISLIDASNKTVALKPNLVVAGTPERGAVTHPGVLSGAIEYFIENNINVKDISIIEGSWVGDETMRAMRRAGYDKVCEKYNVKFYDLKKDNTRDIDTAIGKIAVCVKALDAGLLINLPVLKGHCQTVMTCALKNLKGCLPDREKRRFHALGLTKPIAALGAALKPKLTIVDSICGDLDFEEGGNPVQTNRMYLGFDAVKLDAYGLNLMGLSFNDVPYVKLAEKYGGGVAEVLEQDIINLNEPENSQTENYRVSGIVANLTKRVKQDKACSACFANLVRALHITGRTDIDISIGQGWRGKEIKGLGVGVCCKNADKCVMGCPPDARAIAEVLESY